jgi:DNA-binding MarR family transcriptional regulator
MFADPAMPSPPTVLEDLPFCLARFGISFRRFNDRTLRAVGLKAQAPGLASVVHALREEDDCPVHHLVARTHLPNGTLTGLLDALEAERYVLRVRDTEDGRSWRIRLTAKGHRLGAKLEERHRMVMAVFGEVLTDAESAAFKQLLARVSDRMRTYNSSPVAARGARDD